MGTEQCAVVFSSVASLMSSKDWKLLSRWSAVGLRIDGVVSVGNRVALVNKGTTESDRERWRTDIQCNKHQKSVGMEGSQPS